MRDCDYNVMWKHRHNESCPDHPDARWVKRRRIIKPGRIDFEQVQRELAGAGIELRGGAADEAPGAYKRLDAVIAAHGGHDRGRPPAQAARRRDGRRGDVRPLQGLS